MATATVLPDMALQFAERMSEALEPGRVEELSVQEVSAAILTCSFLRNLFSMVRQSIETALSDGVDAKSFAAKYERAVPELDKIMATTARVVQKARTSHLPPPTEELVTNYQALGEALADLRHFLVEVLAKVKAPVRPIDWTRVQEAEAAYARGETKPFQKTSRAGG
jgi:hypothetical protein